MLSGNPILLAMHRRAPRERQMMLVVVQARTRQDTSVSDTDSITKF